MHPSAQAEYHRRNPMLTAQTAATGIAGSSFDATAPGWQELADCHAAEHLLMGTHRDEASRNLPVCLTCRFR